MNPQGKRLVFGQQVLSSPGFDQFVLHLMENWSFWGKIWSPFVNVALKQAVSPGVLDTSRVARALLVDAFLMSSDDLWLRVGVLNKIKNHFFPQPELRSLPKKHVYTVKNMLINVALYQELKEPFPRIEICLGEFSGYLPPGNIAVVFEDEFFPGKVISDGIERQKLLLVYSPNQNVLNVSRLLAEVRVCVRQVRVHIPCRHLHPQILSRLVDLVIAQIPGRNGENR